MTTFIEIEIGGKPRGWRFNNFAFRTFIFKAMGHNYSAAAPYAMFYAGLMAACYVKDIPIDFTFEQACEWADIVAESRPEIIEQMNTIFTESVQYKKVMGIKETVTVEVEQTEEEKKNIGMTASDLQPAD